MHSSAYDDMVMMMDNGSYTEGEAKKALSKLYAHQQLTDDEYDELMEKANQLSVNTPVGQFETRIVALEQACKKLEIDVANVKEKLSEEGTEIPEPEPGQTGSEYDPIDAQRGMVYYKDKYYRDLEDGQVYLCTRDSDSDPGTGVALAYLPHELVNVYFNFVRTG